MPVGKWDRGRGEEKKKVNEKSADNFRIKGIETFGF